MNNIIDINIQAENNQCVPVYQTSGSSGADLCAFIKSSITIKPGQTSLVATGLKIAVPDGYEAQVRSRSGLAAKHGIVCLNSPGTIDSDYRGEIHVILHNHGDEAYVVNNGDRIAQLVITPVIKARFIVSDALPETKRSGGGFGSTGI